MALDQTAFDADESDFTTGFDTGFTMGPALNTEVPPVDAQTALSQALAARGVELDSLSDTQAAALQEFASVLSKVEKAELENADDAVALLAGDLDVTAVDDFRTIDGQKLNGAATANGKIYIDADLTGDELIATLTEELAESAHFAIVGDTSAGDFGAEVVARLEGEATAAELAGFVDASQNDTVETEFGTAEADTVIGAGDRDAFANALKAATGGKINSVDMLIGFDNGAMSAPVRANEAQSQIGMTSGDFNISSVNGRFDLNGDGVKDTYSIRAYYGDVNSDSVKIINATPTRIIPTSESELIRIGKGESSTTWVLRKEQTHTTTAEFNYNVSIAKEISASVTLAEVLTGGVSITASASVGGGVTSGNSFTVANEVRKTYTVPADAYEEGTFVRYGYHMMTADIEAEEAALAFIDITNARDGFDDTIELNGTSRKTVEDHAIGLIATDYDTNNTPGAQDLLNSLGFSTDSGLFV